MFNRKKGYDVPASPFDFYKPPEPQKGERVRDGGNVDYWYEYAQHMKLGYKDLVEAQDGFVKLAVERKANDAGLRAVVRYLLAELRKTQPNHPLLDKKNRDRIFEEFAKEEMEKLLKRNEMQNWDPLMRPDEHQSE